MDAVQQNLTRLTNGLRSMTVTARAALVVIILLFVTGLSVLMRSADPTTDHYLLEARVFTPAELARMEAAFSKAALNHYEIHDNRIRVPLSKRNQYMAALDRDQALPTDISDVFDEMVKTDSWLESSEQRKLKIQAGLERQAAKLFTEMAGIERAIVKFGAIDHGEFGRRTKRTATVALRMVPGMELELTQVRAIQNALAGFGVDSGNAAVFDLAGRVTYLGRNHSGSPDVANRVYAAAQALHEKRLVARIQQMLSIYPGVKVGVHVQLRTGEPGRGAESAGASPDATTGEALIREPSDSLEFHWVPDRVTASISLPRSYIERCWRDDRRLGDVEQSSAGRRPTPEELKLATATLAAEIGPRVANLLPRGEDGVDRLAQVDVGMHPDPAPPVVAASPNTAVGEVTNGVRFGGWMLLVAVGLLALIWVRPWGSVVGWRARVPVEHAPLDELPRAPVAARPNAADGAERAADELAARIQTDRDTAVHVLRHWVDSAA